MLLFFITHMCNCSYPNESASADDKQMTCECWGKGLILIFFVFRFLFNDAEVKQFDPSQIATECFGGEMTVRYCVLYVILWLQVALYLHKIYHDMWYMFEPALSMDPDLNKK